MLFHNDVVTHGQPKAGAFARRFGREKRIEDLVFHTERYSGPVVPDADFDADIDLITHIKGKVLYE